MMIIAILAGGGSRRMGRDKAALLQDGVSLLERTARTARAVVPDVLIVGRDRPLAWPLDDVRFVPDEVSGVGPIGGLAAALRHAAGNDVLTLACDMPKLTADALRWLHNAARAHAPLDAGLAVVNDTQIEPLFSVYTPTCLARIDQQVAQGRRSLHALIEAGGFERIAAPPPIVSALVNVNTPEEWEALFPQSP